MAKARFRLNGFEVDTWSETQTFAETNLAIFGIADDPLIPDGTETHDENGFLRILGFSKIYDQGINTMRNATQGEIDTFQGFEDEDRRQIEAGRATGSIDETVPGSDGTRRKETKAISKTELSYTKAIRNNALIQVFKDYINELRLLHGLPEFTETKVSDDLDAVGFSDPDTSEWANRYKSFIDKDD